jgi:hypothetical protein
MDADLTTALGANPTPLERLYAQAIQDTRASTARWTAACDAADAERALIQAERVSMQNERASMQTFRAEVAGQMQWFRDQYELLPKEAAPVFDEMDRLFERCLSLGMDARAQAMTTATSRSTMDDVVADAFYIAEQNYARLRQRKGL